MGEFFDHIPAYLLEWIMTQKLFWVATAPLTPDGHINASPKGVEGTFHAADKNTFWYEDLSGSGNETISHLRENGRITVLFTSLEGPPRILRLFGRGHSHEFGTPEYDNYITPENRNPGSRAVNVIDVYKVQTACGWGVPRFRFESDRATLVNFNGKNESRAEDAKMNMKSLWREWNKESLDGLPGLTTALETEKPLVNNWKGFDFPQLKKNKNGGETEKMIEAGDTGTKEAVKLRVRQLIDSNIYIGIIIGVCLSATARYLQQMIMV